MASKEQVSSLLGAFATLSVTGIGLAIGGAIGSTVLAGIGINLSSNLIEGGCRSLKQHWLNSEDGILNHDIQKAIGRAFVKALSALEKKYLDSEEIRPLKRYEKRSYKDLFHELRQQAQEALRITLEKIQLDPDVKHFLFDAPDVDGEKMWMRLVGEDLIAPYSAQLQSFLRSNLLNEILFWFGQELKTDSPGCNKAWRAFQRMLLQGIYEGVRNVQAHQELISRDLRKLDTIKNQLDQLQENIQSRLPNELFQRDLEVALSQIQGTLRAISQTSQRIDQNVEIISRDVKSLLERQAEVVGYASAAPGELLIELSDIRKRMLTAESRHELKQLYYEIEALLAKNPHHPEALLLKDQVREAVFYATAPKLSLMAEEARASGSGLLRARRRFTLTGLLTIFMMVATAASLFTFYSIRRNSRGSAALSGGVIRESSPSTISNEGFGERQQTIDYWTNRVNQRKARWNPEVREDFERNIMVLDQTIKDAQEGLKLKPHDEVYEEMLELALRDKLQLLKEFADL